VEFLIALALVALVAAFVTVPLRRQGTERPDAIEADRAELEALKRTRYAEIRDAEADHAAGKLSDEDFERLDRELRADAIDVLKRLDRLEGRKPERPGRERNAAGDSLD
jgi:cytochrome c-type biogenesis protein CcmI